MLVEYFKLCISNIQPYNETVKRLNISIVSSKQSAVNRIFMAAILQSNTCLSTHAQFNEPAQLQRSSMHWQRERKERKCRLQGRQLENLLQQYRYVSYPAVTKVGNISRYPTPSCISEDDIEENQ